MKVHGCALYWGWVAASHSVHTSIYTSMFTLKRAHVDVTMRKIFFSLFLTLPTRATHARSFHMRIQLAIIHHHHHHHNTRTPPAHCTVKVIGIWIVRFK